jgi:hypothetical protein
VVQKAHSLVVFINGHRDTFSAFSLRAQAKKTTEEGTRMYDALVVDVETRWDSELDLLQRLVYFDAEILALYGEPDLAIPGDLMLDRFEFDLAYGMTLVLEPFRILTKFVQYRDKVTLAYIPRWIDRLVSQLSPGAFAARMFGRAPGVLELLEVFQSCLIASIRARFADTFTGKSLALAGLMFIPGPARFVFTNFALDQGVLTAVRDNMLDDLVELLPPDMAPDLKEIHKTMASAAINLARNLLDRTPEEEHPLHWWPSAGSWGLSSPWQGSYLPFRRLQLTMSAFSARLASH